MAAISEAVLKKKSKLLREALLYAVLGALFMPLSFIILFAIIGGLAMIVLGVSPFSIWVMLAVLAVLAIDTILHPDEEWVRVKFSLSSMFKNESGPVIDEFGPGSSARIYLFMPELRKGFLSAMPYMTNLGDPANWVAWAKHLANGLSNVSLAGPRHLKKAVGLGWFYSNLNDPVLQRLQTLLDDLKTYGGEYVFQPESPPPFDASLVPLAANLGLVGLTSKTDTGSHVLRIINSSS